MLLSRTCYEIRIALASGDPGQQLVKELDGRVALALSIQTIEKDGYTAIGRGDVLPMLHGSAGPASHSRRSPPFCHRLSDGRACRRAGVYLANNQEEFG